MLSKSKIKKIIALKQKKIRNQQGQFLIEGIRLCEESLISDFRVIEFFYQKETIQPEHLKKLLELAEKQKAAIHEIDAADTKQLADTVHSQGIFCIVQMSEDSAEEFLQKNPGYLLLIDAGQDPGNVGTLIRTADWFGFDGVILGAGSVDKYNSKVIRSTMGSFFHLPIISNVDLTDLLQTLKQKNFQIISADVRGDTFFHQHNYASPLALVLGNENRGISEEVSHLVDFRIRIPSFGKAESLNLAQAGAVIMSQIKIKDFVEKK